MSITSSQTSIHFRERQIAARYADLGTNSGAVVNIVEADNTFNCLVSLFFDDKLYALALATAINQAMNPPNWAVPYNPEKDQIHV